LAVAGCPAFGPPRSSLVVIVPLPFAGAIAAFCRKLRYFPTAQFKIETCIWSYATRRAFAPQPGGPILSIKFVLLKCHMIQIDYLFDSNTKAIRVSSICDIKPFISLFYFYCNIPKVHPDYSHERCTFPPFDQRFQFPELSLSKYGLKYIGT